MSRARAERFAAGVLVLPLLVACASSRDEPTAPPTAEAPPQRVVLLELTGLT